MNPGPAAPADLGLLSGLAPELAAAFVSLASDIALVIDDGGVIRNVAVGDAGPAAAAWIGRPWAETVTGDTRRKIELLLQEVGSTGVARRREVNHPSPGAPDIPIAYTAIRLGEGGPVLAVGRDLRAVAAIQQRFVDAQQEMEREYWRLRQAQTRQRLLDQVARDAVLVVDAQTLAVLQANRGAAQMFGAPGSALPDAIGDLLVMARSTGHAAEVRTRLGGGEHIELSATPFRAPGAEHNQRLLVRARPVDGDDETVGNDAVVVTDSAGRVLMANAAFGPLCRDGGVAIGRMLVDVLGDPQRALAALLAEVRREGIAHAAALVSGNAGGTGGGHMQLQVSASLLAEGDQECIGITLRRLDDPAAATPLPGGLDGLARQLEQLLGRVGELPLAALVHEAAALAERHAIGAARRRSADDTAAAVMLGITDDELRQRVQRLGSDTV